MKLSTPLLLLLSSPLITAASAQFALYAYGESISGLRIFYGDSLAYIGSTPPANVTSSSNITLTPTGSHAEWVANSSSITSTARLYVNVTPGAFEPVGFTPSSSVDNTNDGSSGMATTGFGFYGRTVVRFDSSTGQVSSSFWATDLGDGSGTFVLGWNQDGRGRDGSVPVTLRDVGPKDG